MVAFLHIGIGLLERAIPHFTKMEQTFQAIGQGDECAKIDDIGHLPFDQLAFVIALLGVVPRVA